MQSNSAVISHNLSHERLDKLKQSHPTLKLLNAGNAPLIISFLYLMFVQPNKRTLAYSELLSRLSDYLYLLQQRYAENKYPRTAKEYLDEWTSNDSAFLRKYYTNNSDEPECDLTPATEKAIEWLQGLEQKQFIGTESRLLNMFQLLREMANKTQHDPQLRIAELERQKAQIEDEIQKIRSGHMMSYDARQIKERFIQVEGTARALLSDFRQIEYNFRALDREARERIATSTKNKGALLDDLFQEQDIIQDSDQGKSFKAFWEFLMMPARQQELQELLTNVLKLTEIQTLNHDDFLANIHFYLLEAGEKVYKTTAYLAEQLRKYLDDQTYLENKRIMELIKNIEKQAIAVKDHSQLSEFYSEVSDLKPSVELFMSRTLFMPPKNPIINDVKLLQGISDIEIDALYQQIYVDEAELLENIAKALQTHSQISLTQLLNIFPLRKGLAELITYIHLADKSTKATINTTNEETIALISSIGIHKHIKLPQIIFTR